MGWDGMYEYLNRGRRLMERSEGESKGGSRIDRCGVVWCVTSSEGWAEWDWCVLSDK